MKNFKHILKILMILTVVSLSAQQKNERFEKFKEMKLNFILENTEMTSEEEGIFKELFEVSENKYHNEVWVLKRKVRKGIAKEFETISSESASKYINDYYQFEQLGMTIKHQRNQKLLKNLRPKVVLHILNQEKEFDEVMFKRIRNNNKDTRKKEKDRK